MIIPWYSSLGKVTFIFSFYFQFLAMMNGHCFFEMEKILCEMCSYINNVEGVDQYFSYSR